MALIKADRVKESSTSTGASTFALAGAFTGFRSFSSVCSVGDTFYYVIDSDLGSEWETGLGTYSAANTLTRTTVHSSSNGGSIVTFSAGTKNVYISLTGQQLGTLATLSGSEVLTNKTINASNNTITNVSLTTGVTGTLPLVNGGTGTTTAQLAINALAGAVTSGSYLRGNGTNVVMAAIQAADVPTLNQNTTGTASGSVSGTASYVPKFTSANVVGNSQIFDNGTSVGIATASPGGSFRLDVSGSIRSIGTGYQNSFSPTLTLTNSTATTGRAWGINSDNTGLFQVFDITAGTATRMVIDSSGNIGVNSLSPGAQLQVTSAAAATKALVVRGASAQSANLQEWQNSAGSVLSAINSAGVFTGTASGSVSGTASYVPKFTSTNVVGNSLIYDSGTNVGIGTASPSGRVHISATGATEAKIEGTTGAYWSFIKGGTNYGYVGLGSSANNDIYLSTNGSGFVTLYYAQALAASAATKGLVVKGFVSQTANLQEWQDSSGTVLTSVTNGGNVGIGTTSPSRKLVVAANGVSPQILIYKSPDGSINASQQVATLGTGSSGNNTGTTGGSEYGILELYHGGTLRCFMFAAAGYNSYFLDALSIGSATASAQLHVVSTAAATKGMIVRGASAQSANLQEWQNNAGSVLSAVKPDGSIQPASMADSAASNNSIYYSTTASKLAYKDSAGTVNNLY